MNRGILSRPEPAPVGDTGLDMAYTMLPYEASTTGGTGAVGRAYYMRAFGRASQVRALRVHIGTSAGNICLGVYDNNGLSGKLAKPVNRKATTGSVASPGTGIREFTLDRAVDVNPGDWLAWVPDDTGLGIARGSAVVGDYAGFAWFQASGFPLPDPAGALIVPSTGFYIVTA